MNADGWGVGFYAGSRAEPARWRSNRPLWGDASFASVAPVISSGCVLAAVRSATAGRAGDRKAPAPLQAGGRVLSPHRPLQPAPPRPPPPPASPPRPPPPPRPP